MEEVLEQTRQELEKTQEQLARYKTRTALILKQRRGCGDAPDSAAAAHEGHVSLDAEVLPSVEAAAEAREREIERVRAERDAALVARGELQQEVARLQGVVVGEEGQRALVEAECRELKRQVESLKEAKLHTETSMRKTIDNELSHLQLLLAQLQTQLADAKVREAALRAHVQRQERELDAANAQVDQLLSQRVRAPTHTHTLLHPMSGGTPQSHTHPPTHTRHCPTPSGRRRTRLA